MQQNFFDTKDNFKEIIKSHLPKSFNISQVQTGWTNFVYEVHHNKSTYYFRFPRNDFFSDALVKEYHFCQFIRNKISFSVPNLKLNFNNKRPYTIHRGIKGESLSSCYSSLTEKEKTRLSKDISKMIFEFANIDFKKFADRNFQLVSNFLDNLSLVSQNNYDITKHDFLKKLENSNIVLSHGDFNPGNLILRNNKLVAVIDFSFAGISSEYVDLSRIIGRTPKEFRNFLIPEFEKKFSTKIDLNSLSELEKTWQYIEEKYILYIKQNHPTIVLPTLK